MQGALSEQDLFWLAAFDDDQVDTFGPKPIAGTRENRDLASNFLEQIGARGGTETRGEAAAARGFRLVLGIATGSFVVEQQAFFGITDRSDRFT
jgi:hypothetical protein